MLAEIRSPIILTNLEQSLHQWSAYQCRLDRQLTWLLNGAIAQVLSATLM